MFFFSRGLVRTFSSSSTRRFRHFLDCSPWTNISCVVLTLRTEFVAKVTIGLRYSRNLLWCFVFIIFVLCLVTTFIGRLLYWIFPTLRSEFYCILFYNELCADVMIGLPRWSPSWTTHLINPVLRPIFSLLPLHRVSHQSTAMWLRQDFYRIMLGVCNNRSIVSC